LEKLTKFISNFPPFLFGMLSCDLISDSSVVSG